jgi:hypothetical protein
MAVFDKPMIARIGFSLGHLSSELEKGPLDQIKQKSLEILKRYRAWGPRVLWHIGIATLAVLAVYALTLFLVLSRTPFPEFPLVPPLADGGKARNILKNSSQNSQNLNTQERNLTLSADDIVSAGNFALAKKQLKGAVFCDITGTRLVIKTSIITGNLWGPWYLNMRLIADNAERNPIIKRLQFGTISIPSPISGWLVDLFLRIPNIARFERVGEKLIKNIQIQEGRISLTINWNRKLLLDSREAVTVLKDKDRIRIYFETLSDILANSGQSHYIRLGRLLRPLFELARQRSAEQGQDPVAENRALIFVLAAYVSGKDLGEALDSNIAPMRLGVLLNKRIDTAQHFLGTAAMSMAGQGTLVDMIGLAKELHDSHDGGGFSFIDLAADEAGAYFGRLAISSPENAIKLQNLLSQDIEESRIIPPLKDLPESMSEEEFVARYKDVGSPEFEAETQKIRDRIRGLPIYD